MFVGRDHELGHLAELHDSGRPELFVLFGRRRVGKTELLQQFCRERLAVYFLAAQARPKDNLRAFRETLREGLGDELAGSVEFADWSSALAFAADRAAGRRLVVVLDEFPYLCESDKGLPSQLQRFWDTLGKRSSLMLVLCGSQVAFMEKQVLAERSPLFGRRTAQRRLEPLSPAESLAFFPRWSLRDRVLAFAVLGGMPAYLQRFDDQRSLRENLLRELLRPEGYLFDEVHFLLRSELTSPATYNSILQAVAAGAERLNDIALEVGVDSTTAGKYLHVLRELDLIERQVPLTDPHPLRSRRGTYRVTDRFVAFHFRHLEPRRNLIQAGRGSRVLEEFIEPDFNRLFEDAQVEFILHHLRREAAELLGEEVVEAGRFDGLFVRAVARTAAGAGVAAIVPPEAGTPTTSLERELEELRAAFGPAVRKLSYRLGDRPEWPLEVDRIP